VDAVASLKYDDRGLIPVVVQDDESSEVLMVAYMNQESLRKTIETGLATYWSRSRKSFWVKGETSGHVQRVRSISVDCDSDTVLLKVDQTGAACHENYRSCFFRDLREGALMVNDVPLLEV
jgi:phosphoribosyl-AMP cyclohydrolase